MLTVRYSAIAAAIAALMLSSVQSAAQPNVDRCDVPSGLTDDESPLSNAAAAVKRDKALKIVVLGSSSSMASGTTNADGSWPKRLEVHLSARFPGTVIRVVNRSIAGQGAQKMLDRLQADVISEKPALIVWQTGTAEAVRGVEPDQFISTLLAGVDKLTTAGIDVMLMDPQYSRYTARVINFQPYVDALRQVSAMRNLVLLPRYSIMRFWVESGNFNFVDLPRAQAAEVADQVYDCIGRIVARVVAAKLK